MADRSAATFWRHLRGLVAGPPAIQVSDRQLITRFADHHDEAAFALLVRRHGPLVLSLCRRLLADANDADDVFQATFLALARQARAIRKPGSLASWLHGVAVRLARKVKKAAWKRRHRPAPPGRTSPPDPLTEITGRELCAVLDEELERLPAANRLPLVFCYLQGQTQDEAARQLGCPLGTLRSRLERGRQLLRQRLTRRGLSFSAILLATELAGQTARAVVPAARATALAQAAVHFAGRADAAAGTVSAGALALARTATQTGLVTGLRSLVLGVLVLAGLAAGAGLVAHGTARDGTSGATAPRVPKARIPINAPSRTDWQGDALPAGAVGRLGTVRFRHDNWVADLALSPDGATVAAAAGETISLWDANTGQLQRRFPGSEDQVRCVAYAPDGKALASAGYDNWIRLWDLTRRRLIRQFEAHRGGQDGKGIFQLAFCKDGKRLVSAGADGTIRLWQTATGREIRQFRGQRGVVLHLVLSPDGRTVAGVPLTPAEPNEVLAWDVDTGQERWRVQQGRRICAVAFSGDSQTLAAVGGDVEGAGNLGLYDANTGKTIRKWRGHHRWVQAVAFAPDGKTLATGGYDQTIRRWQVRSGREVSQPLVHRQRIFGLRYGPGGRSLLAWGAGNTIHAWDLGTGQERLAFDGHQNWIASVVFSPDGRLLSSGSGGFHYRLWDVAARREKHRSTRPGGNVVAFAADGRTVAAAGYDGTITIHDAASGKVLDRPAGARKGVTCLAFSPDGQVLAVAHAPGVLELWDVGRGRKTRSWRTSQQWIDRLALSADGRQLASASQGGDSVQLWDAAAGRAAGSVKTGALTGLALSADGKTLATGALENAENRALTIQLWETATGRKRATLRAGSYSTALVFAPDSRTLASAYDGAYRPVLPTGLLMETAHKDEGTIKVWDLATGKQARRLDGHQGGVRHLAYAPDGKLLASGGNDTTILLWDVSDLGQRRRAGSPQQLEAAWADLGGTDGAQAYQAIWTLAGMPDQAVAFLERHVLPVTPADPRRIARLLTDLDSRRFAARRRAEKELEQLGTAAESSLRAALRGDHSVEVRQRIEQLLHKLESTRDRTRRALEALEIIGLSKAGRFLEKLARGDPAAWLTQEAKASRGRQGRQEP
jgi:RNA polymerase sigma factor (sigma-70 family)